MRINKRIAVAVLSFAVVLGVAMRLATHARVHAQTGCSVQSLNGSYGYAHTGYYFVNQTLNFFSAAGVVTADGNGGLTGIDTMDQNGAITRNRTYTGTYQLASNCMGSIVFSQSGQISANMDFVVTNGGRSIKFIQSDAGTAITGSADLVTAP